MKENVLLFHIGVPKTGTTSIQDFLFRNTDILKKYGWYYPDILKDMAYLTGEDYKKGQRNGMLLRRSITNEWDEKRISILWRDLCDHLRYNNVIISDEMISAYPKVDTEKALSNFKSHYDNIKVILYLRRQDLFIESVWNQGIKTGQELLELTLDDYIDLLPYAKSYADYMSLIQTIEKIIGRENIIIRVFEKEQFSGLRRDVISDFLDTLSNIGTKRIPEDECWNFPEQLNTGLDGEKLWMKYIFNREYSQYTKCSNKLVDKAFVGMENKKKDKCGYFTREERRAILSSYQHDNEIIAREYLNRFDGRLFYNMDTDIPVYIPDITDREKELIRIFAKAIYEEEEQIKKIGSEQTGLKNSITAFLKKTGREVMDVFRKVFLPVRFKSLEKRHRTYESMDRPLV